MEEVVEREKLMTESEFEDYIKNGIIYLRFSTYYMVGKYKSVRRAIRRGHVTINGVGVPNRPFHNKKNSCKRKGKHSRAINEEKKRIYARIREYQRKHAD